MLAMFAQLEAQVLHKLHAQKVLSQIVETFITWTIVNLVPRVTVVRQLLLHRLSEPQTRS